MTAEAPRTNGGALTRSVEIVTIGDELLLGFTIDTNAAHIARALAELGIAVVRRTTAGDDPRSIAEAVRDALDRTGAVITTGGLGPTADDLTKESIAEIFGRDLVEDEEHVAWMRRRWRERFNRELPEANRRQALMPRGARKLVNRHGSAPGIWLEDDRGRWTAMLPGVPREMRGMLADTLLPILRDRFATGAVLRSRTVRTTGIAESLLAERIGDGGGVAAIGGSLAYLPFPEGVDLRVTVRAPSADAAEHLLDTAATWLRERVGNHVYGVGDADLAAVVLDICRANGQTIGVAESCTGGLLGARLTSIAGSSDVFLGGVIAYADAVKRELLGVSAADLAAHGAVSEPVARQMATGVRSQVHATIGIGVTGVAGPGGGSPEKPVGTVWVGVDVDGRVVTRLLHLIGDREEIRRRATQAALEIVRREVRDERAKALSSRQSQGAHPLHPDP